MAWFQYLIPVYNLLQVRHHFPAETGTCSLCPAQSTSFNKLEIPKCQSKHYYFRRALERPNPKMSKKGQNEKNCRRSMEVSLFFFFFFYFGPGKSQMQPRSQTQALTSTPFSQVKKVSLELELIGNITSVALAHKS